LLLFRYTAATDIYRLSLHDALPILNYRERTLLIGCGAAAGIAAVFNAPIAGVIFAIEVLLTDVIVVSYFIPLIISSVVGALCSKDRKSTRLNSSHVKISYAVFCLKK